MHTSRCIVSEKKADTLPECMAVISLYRNTAFFKELLRLFAEYWFEFSPSIFKIDEFETKEAQRIIRETWNFLMRND